MIKIVRTRLLSILIALCMLLSTLPIAMVSMAEQEQMLTLFGDSQVQFGQYVNLSVGTYHFSAYIYDGGFDNSIEPVLYHPDWSEVQKYNVNYENNIKTMDFTVRDGGTCYFAIKASGDGWWYSTWLEWGTAYLYNIKLYKDGSDDNMLTDTNNSASWDNTYPGLKITSVAYDSSIFAPSMLKISGDGNDNLSRKVTLNAGTYHYSAFVYDGLDGSRIRPQLFTDDWSEIVMDNYTYDATTGNQSCDFVVPDDGIYHFVMSFTGDGWWWGNSANWGNAYLYNIELYKVGSKQNLFKRVNSAEMWENQSGGVTVTSAAYDGRFNSYAADNKIKFEIIGEGGDWSVYHTLGILQPGDYVFEMNYEFNKAADSKTVKPEPQLRVLGAAEEGSDWIIWNTNWFDKGIKDGTVKISDKNGKFIIEFHNDKEQEIRLFLFSGWVEAWDTLSVNGAKLYMANDKTKKPLTSGYNKYYWIGQSYTGAESAVEISDGDGIVDLGGEPQMIKFNISAETRYAQFYQMVRIAQPGKYIFQCYFKLTKYLDNYAADKIRPDVWKDYASVDSTISIDKETNLWTIEFEVTEPGNYMPIIKYDTTFENQFQVVGTDVEAYFYAPTLFAKSDKLKNNLIRYSNFNRGTLGWSKAQGKSDKADIGAQAVNIDESIFLNNEYMIKLLPTENVKSGFYQAVNLLPGSYIYEGYLSNKKTTVITGESAFKLDVLDKDGKSLKVTYNQPDKGVMLTQCKFKIDKAGDYQIGVTLDKNKYAKEMESWFYNPYLYLESSTESEQKKDNLLNNPTDLSNWSARNVAYNGSFESYHNIFGGEDNGKVAIKYPLISSASDEMIRQILDLDIGQYVFEIEYKTDTSDALASVIKPAISKWEGTWAYGSEITESQGFVNTVINQNGNKYTLVIDVNTAGKYEVGIEIPSWAIEAGKSIWFYGATFYKNAVEQKPQNRLENCDFSKNTDKWKAKSGLKAIRDIMPDMYHFSYDMLAPDSNSKYMANFKLNANETNEQFASVSFSFPWDTECEYYRLSFFAKDKLSGIGPAYVQSNTSDGSAMVTIQPFFTEGDKYTYLLKRNSEQKSFNVSISFPSTQDLDVYITGFELYKADEKGDIIDKSVNYGDVYGYFNKWYQRSWEQVGGLAYNDFSWILIDGIVPLNEELFDFSPLPEVEYSDDWWKNLNVTDDEYVETGIVRGVLSSEYGAPIKNAKLQLVTTVSDWESMVTTDKNGKFVFDDVPVGVSNLYYITENGDSMAVDAQIELINQNDIVELNLVYVSDKNISDSAYDENDKQISPTKKTSKKKIIKRYYKQGTNFIWIYVLIGLVIVVGGVLATVILIVRKKKLTKLKSTGLRE